MNNFWDDEEESVSEYELVEEAQEVEDLAAQHAQEPVIVEASEDEIEEILEDAAFDLNEEEANIVYNTRIRLEQAKLYEMLINHDLFEGVNIDARAVAIVQNELKHYVVKRLEILMGLRQPAVRTQEETSQFNEVEVDFIKQLAYKGTKGRSASEEHTEPAPPAPTGGLRPVTQRVKSTDLKPIVKAKPQQIDPPQRKTNKPKPQKKATPPQKTKKKTTVPRQRKVKVSSSLGARELRPDEVEALAKEDLELMKNRKPIHKMNAKEKAKAIAEVNARHPAKQRPETTVLPHMDENALHMKYMTEQTKRANATGGKKNDFNAVMASIANKIAVEKNQE